MFVVSVNESIDLKLMACEESYCQFTMSGNKDYGEDEKISQNIIIKFTSFQKYIKLRNTKKTLVNNEICERRWGNY